MNQNIEISLTELLTKIDNRPDRLENKTDQSNEKLQKVEISIEKLNEKVEGTDKRLVNLEFVYRGASVATIGAVLLAIFRYLFPEVTL